jgi:hypothetical protein
MKTVSVAAEIAARHDQITSASSMIIEVTMLASVP